MNITYNQSSGRNPINLSTLISVGDTDGDSALSETEFSDVLNTVLGANADPGMATHLFQRLSSDGTSITQSDVAVALSQTRPEPGGDRRCPPPEIATLSTTSWETLLQEADVDGDGQVSASELQTWLSAKSDQNTSDDARLSHLVEGVSRGDGYIDQADLKAFQDLSQNPPFPPPPFSVKHIEKVSTDVSTVSVEETEAMLLDVLSEDVSEASVA